MKDTPTLTAGDIIGEDSQPDGEWLAPATAASRLGVSERTLWRLVKAGRYHRRVVDRKALILVPSAAPLPDTGATSGAELLPDTAVLAIVDELKRQAEASLGLIAQQAETIGQLRAELAASEAQNAALLASTATPFRDPTPEQPCSRWPRGWIAGAATVLVASVAVITLLAVWW